MNAKELAKYYDGAHIYKVGQRNTDLEVEAKANSLVVVYGQSDDLVEFEGAINDELDAYEGNTFWITSEGLYPANTCDEGDNCPNYVKPTTKTAVPLKAIWCGDSGASWQFDFPVEHEKFRIMEDDEVFCYGIVFSLADVAAHLEAQS